MGDFVDSVLQDCRKTLEDIVHYFQNEVPLDENGLYYGLDPYKDFNLEIGDEELFLKRVEEIMAGGSQVGDPVTSDERLLIVSAARDMEQATRIINYVESFDSTEQIAHLEQGFCLSGVKTTHETSPYRLVEQCRRRCYKDTVIPFATDSRLLCIKGHNSDGSESIDCAKLSRYEVSATVKELLALFIILFYRGNKFVLTSVSGEEGNKIVIKLVCRLVRLGCESGMIDHYIGFRHASKLCTAYPNERKSDERLENLCSDIFDELTRQNLHFKRTGIQDENKPDFLAAAVADPNLLTCVDCGEPNAAQIEEMKNDNRWKFGGIYESQKQREAREQAGVTHGFCSTGETQEQRDGRELNRAKHAFGGPNESWRQREARENGRPPRTEQHTHWCIHYASGTCEQKGVFNRCTPHTNKAGERCTGAFQLNAARVNEYYNYPDEWDDEFECQNEKCDKKGRLNGAHKCTLKGERLNTDEGKWLHGRFTRHPSTGEVSLHHVANGTHLKTG